MQHICRYNDLSLYWQLSLLCIQWVTLDLIAHFKQSSPLYSVQTVLSPKLLLVTTSSCPLGICETPRGAQWWTAEALKCHAILLGSQMTLARHVLCMLISLEIVNHYIQIQCQNKLHFSSQYSWTFIFFSKFFNHCK